MNYKYKVVIKHLILKYKNLLDVKSLEIKLLQN